MKKVLINAQPMTVVGTGIGRYLRGLSGAVESGFGHEVRLSYFTGAGVAETMPGSRGAGWRERAARLLWRMPHPVALGCRLLRHSLTERRFTRECGGFDVYHEAGYFAHPCPTARTVLTVHDLSLIRFPEYHPRERVAFFRRYFMDRLDRADGFCAVSEFTRREMMELLPVDPEKIAVTPLGCDRTIFNTDDDPEARRLLDEAGVPAEFVLFVGTGDPRKNLTTALAALKAASTDAPLVTVGWSGWHRPGAKGAIPLGYVSDRVLAQLYRTARVLLMPSRYEGFGLPVLEAMACGCPVMTSTAEALLEVGGNAVAVVRDVRDAAAFGAALEEVLGSSRTRERLRSAGLKRAAAFDWGRTAGKTVSQWGGGPKAEKP